MLPQFASLPDGRLHFAHGPIDLVIRVDGRADVVQAAHQSAWRRFETVLPELVGELAQLRRPVGKANPLHGTVACRMWEACYPFRADYITPMAAVAGAVAQEIVACYARPGIDRAAVNNGGDIALHLGVGESHRIGICADVSAATAAAVSGLLRPDGEIQIDDHMPVRGIATSGWRGRSFSLGIADSVTVLAATAAQADAAATVIANAVNVQDARIERAPACELKDDSDLGSLLVTADVPRLEADVVRAALCAGLARARRLREMKLIWGAVLMCQGQVVHLHEDAAEVPFASNSVRHASPKTAACVPALAC